MSTILFFFSLKLQILVGNELNFSRRSETKNISDKMKNSVRREKSILKKIIWTLGNKIADKVLFIANQNLKF